MVVDQYTDNAVLFGNETECSDYVKTKNAGRTFERYYYTKKHDYMLKAV